MEYPQDGKETPNGPWTSLEITIVLTIVFTLGFLVFCAWQEYKNSRPESSKIQNIMPSEHSRRVFYKNIPSGVLTTGFDFEITQPKTANHYATNYSLAQFELRHFPKQKLQP